MSLNKRPGGPYVTPIKSDGTQAAEAGERGKYTLASGTTYCFPLGGVGAPTQSVQLEGDASIIITSATIEESNLGESEASDYGTATGTWIKDNGTAGVTSAVGTGWTATARTIAVVGGNVGGAMWQLPDRGAARLRLVVVVGGTGGVVRVSAHGKA
ncbi:MAG TPA: hypothetical protein VM686_37430 [Polyangiaceae bacterium]|nr:hypothetical protein [Polyangiaceae bacterium]